MATITLDTHKALNLMVEKGIPKQQAEGIIADIQEINLEQMADKEDIAILKTEMNRLRSEIFKFILLNTFATITLTVTLLKVIP